MSSVLQRKLFMKPPVKKKNGGILALVEEEAGMAEDGEESYEDRTPDNMEIIANNLRGDVRSLDERYLELAQMVGEKAFDTPEEVLALMQPQLAQQMAQQQGQQPPAATAPSTQGMQQMAQGTPPGMPPQGPGAPPAPPTPPQAPQGIESLVAEEAPPAPVQRAGGSPPQGERSYPTGAGLQIDITGVSKDEPNDDPILRTVADYVENGGNIVELYDALSGAESSDEPYNANVFTGENVSPGDMPDEDSSVPGLDQPLRIDTRGVGSLPVKKDKSEMVAGLAKNAQSALDMAGLNRDAYAEAMNARARTARIMGSAAPMGMTPVLRRAQGGIVHLAKGGEPTFNPNTPISSLDDPRVAPILTQEAADAVSIDSSREPRLNVRVPRTKLERSLAEDGLFQDIDLPKSAPIGDRFEPGMDGSPSTPAGGRLSPQGRTLFQRLRDMGVSASELKGRLTGALGKLEKMPGPAGKIAKALKGLSALDVAVGGGTAALTAMALTGEDEAPKPNEGVVPKLPGAGDPPEPPSVAKPKDLTRVNPPDLGVKEVDVTGGGGGGGEEDDTYRENVITGENVPPGDQIEMGMSAAEAPGAPSAADLTKKPGETDDDFRTRVLKRANVYKELLGEDPESRKAQAYFLLAEAGLALMGAKGYSIGERVSKAFRGVPSGLAKIASEKTQVDRAAVTAAISAVEQEDRDRLKYGTAALIKQAEIAKSNAPRLQKIALTAQTAMASDPNLTEDQARILATGIVDGIYKGDEFGNVRGPDGNIINRGPAMRPVQPNQVGYIDDNNPFLTIGEQKVPPVISVDEIKQARGERNKITSLLGSIQMGMANVEKAYGIGNVFTRAVTSGVTPFVGDIGPFSSDKLAAANAIKLMQRNLREIMAVNETRVSVYEQQQIDGLLSDPNALLATPEQAIDQLQNLTRSLVNRVNQLDASLNPDMPLRQLGKIPLGTKNDPVPFEATRALDSFFADRPKSMIYVQRQDGKVFGVTREQWNQMQGEQK